MSIVCDRIKRPIADVGHNNVFRSLDLDKRCIVSQVWTEAPSIPAALVSVLLKLPNIKFVIVTLGEDGCMMLERAEAGMLAYFFGSSDVY